MLNLKRVEPALLFLTLLFLPTQLGLHFWPKFSFVYSLPIDYLSPTLYFWDLLTGFLYLVFIFRRSQVNKLALNLFFIFILTQSLSLLFSSNIGVGLVRLEQYFIAGLLGVYLSSVKHSWVKQIIFWGFVWSIIGESFLAIAQFIKGGTVGFWLLGERTFSLSTPGIAKFDFYGREFLRPYATFPHPNVLAGFMLMGIVILTSMKKEIMVFGATMLASLTILLTVSRVAILAGLVFATAVLTQSKARFLLLLAVIILLPILYTRFSSLANFDNLTFVRRGELSLIAIKIWATSPIFGVGLNNFIPTAADLLLSGPSRFLQPVHNIFLLALAETGIAGLAGLIILIGYPIYKSSKLNLFLWGVVFFLGMFDHYFLTLPQGYRLLFLIWGLTWRMLK